MPCALIKRSILLNLERQTLEQLTSLLNITEGNREQPVESLCASPTEGQNQIKFQETFHLSPEKSILGKRKKERGSRLDKSFPYPKLRVGPRDNWSEILGIKSFFWDFRRRRATGIGDKPWSELISSSSPLNWEHSTWTRAARGGSQISLEGSVPPKQKQATTWPKGSQTDRRETNKHSGNPGPAGPDRSTNPTSGRWFSPQIRQESSKIEGKTLADGNEPEKADFEDEKKYPQKLTLN